MKHTDNCGRSGPKEVIVLCCKLDCTCKCHDAKMENLKHGEKIVDGILIKYLCQPCPGCKAKLEAGEDMAEFIKRLTLSQNVFLSEEAKSCYLAWEKAGKGET